MVKITFREKFDRIVKAIDSEGVTDQADTLLALQHLDMIVDAIIIIPGFRDDLHEHIRGLMGGMLDYEYDEAEKADVAYA